MSKSKEEVIGTLKEIAKDMQRDAEEMDGKPFNGKTIATYMGYHGAAIASIATLLADVLSEEKS